MTRPRLAILLLSAVLVAGCGTFSDNDAVARVGDVELSTDEMTELIEALGAGDPADAGVARESITLWVRIEAIKGRLAQEGIVVTEEELDEATNTMSSVVPGFAELSDRMRDYLVDAQAAFLAFDAVPPPAPADIQAFYERGVEESGLACVAHILVATETEADEILAELAGGADFAQLAADRSVDTSSGGQGGNLPCTTADAFRSTYVPPFADAALAADIGEPIGPVETDFGYHVIMVRPYESAAPELDFVLSPQEFVIARSIEEADVHVDPRYGTLDDGVVVALS